MGMPMASNLAKKGHRVYGYDIVESKLTEASTHGIIPHHSIAETVKHADIIITNVPATKHV